MSPKRRIKEESSGKKSKKLKVSFQSAVIQEFASDCEIKKEIELEDESAQLPTKKNPEEIPISWPTNDLQNLIKGIENAIPRKDTITYKSRVEKLNWDEIAFGEYSADDCKKTWMQIQDRVRHFRILRELVEDAKEWITKPWTHFYRGVKRNRHPDMPKRPLSSYMLFYLNEKDKVLKENPGIEMTDLSRQMAEMYKNETKSTKDKFNLLAGEERRKYEERLDEFYRNHPEMMRINVEKGGKSHNSGSSGHGEGPAKPSTPFKIFCDDKIKRMKNEENFDRNSVIEQCKQQWKSMADKKKVFWIDWALEEESRYLEKVKLYKSENPDFVPHNFKQILTKEEKSIKERMAGKPTKPPNSAYSLFSAMMLKSGKFKEVNPKLRMQGISLEWKKLSEDDKKEYRDRVQHLLEQYKLDFATYLESLPDEKKAEELLNAQPKRKQTTSKKTPKIVEEEGDEEKPEEKKKKKKKHRGAPDVTDQLIVVEGEPVQPPGSAYEVFVETYAKGDASKLKKTEKIWKKMSEDDKRVFRKELKRQKKIFIEKWENFLKSLSKKQLKEYSKIHEHNQEVLQRKLAKTPQNLESESSSSSSDTDSSD